MEILDKIMNEDMLPLDHGEKCLLFVIMAFEELREMNLMEGGPFTVNITKEQAKELIGDDFNPSPKEIESVIQWMKEEGYMA